MATARLNNYRQSPRKVRLLADLVRGKTVSKAILDLEYAGKRAGGPLVKLIRSAAASAKNEGDNPEAMVISDIRVDQGVVMKRMMPRARGSAFQILKRTSHVVVTLGAGKESAKTEKKAEKKVKTAK